MNRNIHIQRRHSVVARQGGGLFGGSFSTDSTITGTTSTSTSTTDSDTSTSTTTSGTTESTSTTRTRTRTRTSTTSSTTSSSTDTATDTTSTDTSTSTTTSSSTTSTESTTSNTSTTTSKTSTTTAVQNTQTSSFNTSIENTSIIPSITGSHSSATSAASTSPSGGINTGAVVGGIAGGLFALAIIAFFIVAFIRRRNNRLRAEEFDAAQFRRSAIVMDADDSNGRGAARTETASRMSFWGGSGAMRPMSMLWQKARHSFSSQHSGGSGAGVAGQGAYRYQTDAQAITDYYATAEAQGMMPPDQHQQMEQAAIQSAPISVQQYEEQERQKVLQPRQQYTFGQAFEPQRVGAAGASSSSRAPIVSPTEYGQAYLPEQPSISMSGANAHAGDPYSISYNDAAYAAGVGTVPSQYYNDNSGNPFASAYDYSAGQASSSHAQGHGHQIQRGMTPVHDEDVYGGM